MQQRVDEDLVLIGTAHVSKNSVDEVERVIREVRPSTVCVELDAMRLEALQNKRRWEETPIHKFLKGDRVWLFLVQVMLSSYQRRLGKQLGVEPGAELLAAVRLAEAVGAQVVLADRPINITMQRAYRLMRFREKMGLSWQVAMSMVGGEEEEEIDLEAMMHEDVLTTMMNELGERAPSVKNVIIDERDAYLAEKIRRCRGPGQSIVAVVGAGHVAGIRGRLDVAEAVDLDPLRIVPEKRFSVAKAIGWGFPLMIVALLGWFAYQGWRDGNFSTLVDSLAALLFWGGGLAAAGALLAGGHPYSIIAAFVSAPFGILHPGFATGWVAGVVEAWKRTPVVRDFEGIASIETFKAFRKNRVVRVVLVAALTNIGAMIGGAIALGAIFSNLRVG